jgi:hypothetical protein
MYLAQQNIKLNVDNGKLDGWYPEANDEYINLPVPGCSIRLKQSIGYEYELLYLFIIRKTIAFDL